MTTLPQSLTRFGAQLQQAIERDRRVRRRRRAARFAVRLTPAVAIAATLAFVAISLRGEDAPVVGSSVVALASAAERAATVLSPPPGAIVHDEASYRRVDPGGGVSTWTERTWRQTSAPYARRRVHVRGDGARIETASVGAEPAQLYDATTNTIYTNAPDSGAALGTPMPAADGDPLRNQLLELLRSGDARRVTRSERSGRAVIRFVYDNAGVTWTYVVDAASFEPIRMTASPTGDSRVTTRFDTYETLEATERTGRLLSLRAQHPGAAIDATEAGYRAAQARLFAPR